MATMTRPGIFAGGMPMLDPIIANGMREQMARVIEQRDQTTNLVRGRMDIMRGTGFGDPRRNLAQECGYPDFPVMDAWTYKDAYDVDPIAARVVELFPKESWQSNPSIFESQDPSIITPFEEAWYDLQQSLRGEQSWYQDEEGSPIWEQLARADVLCGIGFFGVVLLGIDDGKNLDQPVDGVATMVPVGGPGNNPSRPRGVPGPKGNSPGKSTPFGGGAPRGNDADVTDMDDDANTDPNSTIGGRSASASPGGQPGVGPGLSQKKPGAQVFGVRDPNKPTRPADAQKRDPFSQNSVNRRVTYVKNEQGRTIGVRVRNAVTRNGVTRNGRRMKPAPSRPTPELTVNAKGIEFSDENGDEPVGGWPDGHPNNENHTIAMNALKMPVKPKPKNQPTGTPPNEQRGPQPQYQGGQRGVQPPGGSDTGSRGQAPNGPPKFSGAPKPAQDQAQKGGVGDVHSKPFAGGDNNPSDSSYGDDFGDDASDPREGTQRQYSEEITEAPPSSYSGVQGTDAQYTGVELSPPSYPDSETVPDTHQLLFMRPYDESLVQIVQYEADLRNPRFGMPVMYRITLNDPRQQHSGIGMPLATVRVHWSRVIHIADNLGSSEIFGYPRLQQVYRPVLDSQKIRGASPEGYWKTCFTGLSFETHPTLGGDVEIQKQNLAWQIYAYNNTLQRDLITSGMSVKTLSPTLVDPTPHNAMAIESVCIRIGCPIRVFKGAERGELASSQDDSRWNDRVTTRRNQFITPRIVVPFVDRMIAMGVLPMPDVGYSLMWPDIDSTTDKDKAGILLQTMQALGAYVSQGVEAIVPPKVLLTKYAHMTDEEADEALASASSAAEGQMGGPMTMPQAGERGHPSTEEDPEPPPVIGAPGAGADGSTPGDSNIDPTTGQPKPPKDPSAAGGVDEDTKPLKQDEGETGNG